MKFASSSAAVLGLASITGVAFGQSANSWDGFYAGVNLGAGANTTCSNWALNGNRSHNSTQAASASSAHE
jgi:hypothetical protein